MDLLLLRHGIAEEPSQFRGEDSERPLTSEGMHRMQLEARAMRRLLDRNLFIASSPFVRARETARIVAAEFPQAPFIELSELAMGGSVTRVLGEVAKFKEHSQMLLVGHEPELVEIINRLTGIRAGAVQLKKGALVCLRILGFEPRVQAVLTWHLAPTHLIALAEAASAA